MHYGSVGPMERSTGTKQTRKPARREFCYYVDTHGHQHFNFPQRVWLHASVDMAVTPVMTLALETLAINLLTHLTRERDYRAAVGFTSARVVKLARRFCRECLLTAQAEGWVMPRATLKEWFVARTRAQGRVQS